MLSDRAPAPSWQHEAEALSPAAAGGAAAQFGFKLAQTGPAQTCLASCGPPSDASVPRALAGPLRHSSRTHPDFVRKPFYKFMENKTLLIFPSELFIFKIFLQEFSKFI